MKRIAYILLLLLSAVTSFAQLTPGTTGILYGSVRTFATWSTTNKASSITISNGNLKYTGSLGQAGMGIATIGKSAGKWSWTVTADNRTSSSTEAVGVCTIVPTSGNTFLMGATSGTLGVRLTSPGCVRYNNTFFGTCAMGYLTGDVIRLDFDIDNGILDVYKNGVLVYTKTGLPTGVTWYPACQSDGINGGAYTANFGQSSLGYTPPAGYKAGWYTE